MVVRQLPPGSDKPSSLAEGSTIAGADRERPNPGKTKAWSSMRPTASAIATCLDRFEPTTPGGNTRPTRRPVPADKKICLQPPLRRQILGRDRSPERRAAPIPIFSYPAFTDP